MAYQLPLSALLLLGGAAGDRFGRRRLLLSGTRFCPKALAANLWLWCNLDLPAYSFNQIDDRFAYWSLFRHR
jgi:MFS family permease